MSRTRAVTCLGLFSAGNFLFAHAHYNEAAELWRQAASEGHEHSVPYRNLGVYAWKEMDTGLAKHFAIHKLGEGGDLEINLEAQNAFNTVNFGQPNPDIGTSAVGTITSANASNGLNPYAEGRIVQLDAGLNF
jgi:hypothetical protein